jgi:hypothetical protein
VYGFGETPVPNADIQSLIRQVLAIPELQPIESQVVNAAQPYLPTVAQGFLAGWWATNKNAVLLAAAGALGLWLVLKRR